MTSYTAPLRDMQFVLEEVIGLDQVVQQPNSVRLCGLHDPGREEQLFGDGPTDLHGEAPGGVHPSIGGGKELEAGPLASNPNVETRRHNSSASVC